MSTQEHFEQAERAVTAAAEHFIDNEAADWEIQRQAGIRLRATVAALKAARASLPQEA